MKQQVVRFSPHQTGKVFAVLMAVTSLIFFVPFVLIMFMTSAPGMRPPMLMMIFMPLMYLVMGYVMTAVGCAIYNFMFRYVGGIEFEVDVAED